MQLQQNQIQINFERVDLAGSQKILLPVVSKFIKDQHIILIFKIMTYLYAIYAGYKNLF